MDKLECAGRTLARALGYGSAWNAPHAVGEAAWKPAGEARPVGVSLGGVREAEADSAIDDGLPVCRETETLERASGSVSAWLGRPDTLPRNLTADQRRERAKRSTERMHELWAWEIANPVTRGQTNNPRRPREYEHWKRTKSGAGVQVVRPLHRMNQCALEALAGLPTPLQATLQLYATGDARQWPVVERYARACLQVAHHAGIAEGMFRLLTHPTARTRAKALRMREFEWNAKSLPALRLFESWAARAADAFLLALDSPLPMTGSQGSGHRTETWWRPPALQNASHPPTFATATGPCRQPD